MGTPSFSIKDDHISWDRYNPTDVGLLCFGDVEWHNIAGEIKMNDEWSSFLANNERYFQCYVLRRIGDTTVLALLYIVNEDLKWGTISIHGGAFKCHPITTYRAYILILESILKHKIKIRTQCSIRNERTIKFNKSVGFRVYRKQDETVYMWLNEASLHSSRIYTWAHSSDAPD